jgi:hypothetical protein
MKANVGGIDKKLRIVAGVVVIAAGAITQSWWGVIGIIPLGTALINWCPVYTVAGVCTASKSETE